MLHLLNIFNYISFSLQKRCVDVYKLFESQPRRTPHMGSLLLKHGHIALAVREEKY